MEHQSFLQRCAQLDVPTLKRIDQRCLEFEAARRDGPQPITPFLRGFHGLARQALLYETLVIEFALREAAEEEHLLDQLCAAFPDELWLIQLAQQAAHTGHRRSRTISTVRPEADPPAPLVIPGRLGRYEILRQIGRGGMAHVYLALDTRLGRHVALKLPRIPEADAATYLKRVRREARAAAAVQHPNICPILDVDRIDGQLLLSTEYVEGASLRTLLDENRRPTLQQAVRIVARLAGALQAAHDAGVVHRDISPANVILRPDGEPVLLDFGLARMLHPDASQLTLNGTPLGTPAYMPPEQVEGRSADIGPCSDVYSLGVLLYELLCGRPPFEGSVRSIWSQILHDAPGPPSRHRSRIPAMLDAICLRAIARLPADRFQSMTEFAAALEDAETHLQSSDPNPASGRKRTSESSAAPARRRIRNRAILTAGILLGICLAVIQFRDPDGMPIAGNEGSAAVELQSGPPASDSDTSKAADPNAADAEEDRDSTPQLPGAEADPADNVAEPAPIWNSPWERQQAARQQQELDGVWKLRGDSSREVFAVIQAPYSAVLIQEAGRAAPSVIPVSLLRIAPDENRLHLWSQVLPTRLPRLSAQYVRDGDLLHLDNVAFVRPPAVPLALPATITLSRVAADESAIVKWQTALAFVSGQTWNGRLREFGIVHSIRGLLQAQRIVTELRVTPGLDALKPDLPALTTAIESAMPRGDVPIRPFLEAGGELLSDRKLHGSPIVAALGNETQIDDATLASLEAFPELSRAELADSSLEDRHLEQLQQFGSLRELDLGGTAVTVAALDRLQQSREDMQISSDPAVGTMTVSHIDELAEWLVFDANPSLHQLLSLVPRDAVGVVVLRNMEQLSDHVDHFAGLLGLQPLHSLARAETGSGITRGLDRQGSLIWALSRKPTGELAQLYFLPTTSFVEIRRCVKAQPVEGQSGYYRFESEDLEIIGRDLPDSDYSVYTQSEDLDLLRAYDETPLGLPLNGSLAEWAHRQDMYLILDQHLLAGMKSTTPDLETLIPVLDTSVKSVLRALQTRLSRLQPELISHWGFGLQIEPTRGVVVSTIVSLPDDSPYAHLDQAFQGNRDRILRGVPDEPFAVLLGGLMIPAVKEPLQSWLETQAQPGGGIPPFADAPLADVLLELVRESKGIAAVLTCRPFESGFYENILWVLRGEDQARLMTIAERIMAFARDQLNNRHGQGTSLLFDRKVGEQRILQLRVLFPDFEAAADFAEFIFHDQTLDLFAGAILPDGIAIAFESLERLRDVARAARGNAALSANPQVRRTLELLSPGTQWLLLVDLDGVLQLALETAKALEVSDQIPDLPALPESDPLALAAELGERHFQVSLAVPTPVFSALSNFAPSAIRVVPMLLP